MKDLLTGCWVWDLPLVVGYTLYVSEKSQLFLLESVHWDHCTLADFEGRSAYMHTLAYYIHTYNVKLKSLNNQRKQQNPKTYKNEEVNKQNPVRTMYNIEMKKFV